MSVVLGTGSAYPKNALSNDALITRLTHTPPDLDSAWILSRSGIESRAWVECGSLEEILKLAEEASRSALDQGGCAPENLDGILLTTTIPPSISPALSCRLQTLLGAKNAFCYDFQAASSGALFGYVQAEALLSLPSIEKILVVAVETLSPHLNLSDPNTAILFGDGAGAVVLGSTPTGATSTLRSWSLKTDGSLSEILKTEVDANGKSVIQMEGLRVYRSSADKMLEAAAEVLTRADLNLSDIDYFLPHQANLRLLHFLEEKLPGPVMLSSLQTLGNTSSASVFCGLDRSLRSGTLRAASDSRPTRILVAVYGAGATWGAAILELSSKFIRSYQESTKVRSKP